MRKLRPLTAPGVTGSLARPRDLRAAGVPHWRLYASDQARALYGVVTAPGVDPDAIETKIAAARFLLRDGMFLSRHTAGQLLGLPVDADAVPLSIGAVRPVKPPVRREFVTHQVRRDALLSLPSAPLWLPHPSDVWALLGAVSTVEQLVMVGDCIVSGTERSAPPLATIDELHLAAQRHAGGTGCVRLREALPLIREGVESPAETRLRLLLAGAGFPEPVVSCPVDTLARRFHADLGYPDLKIAIEYEGEYHFSGGVEQARWDLRRYESMQDAGWVVLRVTAIDLRDPRYLFQRLAAAIKAASAR